MCVTVFWAGGNVRDVLGGVHVGVRGGGRRHYRWFSTPSALLKTYTPLVFKVSTQSCPCVSWNCPGSEIRGGERVWWLTGDTVAVSGGLKIAYRKGHLVSQCQLPQSLTGLSPEMERKMEAVISPRPAKWCQPQGRQLQMYSNHLCASFLIQISS